MTQENKDLLIKDLSARVPYGVKFVIDNGLNNIRTLTGIGEDIPYEDWQMCAFARGISAIPIEDIKPYLFPMSSMTDEQREELKREYCNIACDNIKKMFANPDESHLYSSKSSSFEIDYFNKHHIDYRGLIPMGLANDATGLNIY